jgi:hypothetical protein
MGKAAISQKKKRDRPHKDKEQGGAVLLKGYGHIKATRRL